MATKIIKRTKTSKVVPIGSKTSAQEKHQVLNAVTFKPVLTVEDTPFSYANYVEVAHNQHEFSLFIARVPTKVSATQKAAASKTGILELPADLQVSFSPRLAVGLIRALQIQLEAYEKIHGAIQPEVTK